MRWETPLRHAVKNNRGTFSHCNPVFPRKGLWEGDRFLNNYTTLLCRSIGSGVPAAPTGDPLLQQGPVQTAGVDKKSCSMEPLMYHLPEISNSTEEAGWLACLTLVVKKMPGKTLRLCKVWETVYLPQREAGSFVLWITYLYHDSSPKEWILCCTIQPDNNEQRINPVQFLRWKKVQQRQSSGAAVKIKDTVASDLFEFEVKLCQRGTKNTNTSL